MIKKQKGRTSAGSERRTAGTDRRSARPDRRTARPESVHGVRQQPQKRKAKTSARMRKMRKKRIKNTVLLVVLMLILICGAGILLQFFRGGIGSGPVMAYSTSKEFQHQNMAGTSQKAKAFAADLCVVSGDQSMDSVSLEQDQKGVLLNLKDLVRESLLSGFFYCRLKLRGLIVEQPFFKIGFFQRIFARLKIRR